MKTIEKKNKIIGPAGSRTSTRQRLARGLRPVHPRYYNGALQRGNTTGKQNGKQNGKIKNEKMRKVISIFFKFIYIIALNQCVYFFKSNENLKIIFLKKNVIFLFISKTCFKAFWYTIAFRSNEKIKKKQKKKQKYRCDFSHFLFFHFISRFVSPLYFPVVVPRCSTPGGWVEVLEPVVGSKSSSQPLLGRSPWASRPYYFSLFFFIFSLFFIVFQCLFIVFWLFLIILLPGVFQ